MSRNGAAGDEEEDYMSMVIEEPKQKETFTQRKLRKQREAEKRAKVPSKAERAAQEAARRDEALSTSTLDPSNKGFRMMAKLGFKPGDALGKHPSPVDSSNTTNMDRDPSNPANNRRRTEPLNLVFKEGRGGIGLDSEKKRKMRDEAEKTVKKIKHEEGDYRDRVRIERETRRAEAQIRAAQSVAERLDTEAEAEGEDGDGDGGEAKQTWAPEEESTAEPSGTSTTRPKVKVKVKLTSQINVLYRGLVREREERERTTHVRHALQASLPSSFFPNPRLPDYDDPTLEREDKQALGGTHDLSTILEQELDEEDPELDAFNALEPKQRLMKLVIYLREKYRY